MPKPPFAEMIKEVDTEERETRQRTEKQCELTKPLEDTVKALTVITSYTHAWDIENRVTSEELKRKEELRDHNPYGFTVWMADGGIRGGKVIGATGEFGLVAIVDKVHLSDLHAIMLGLAGLDHERLTHHFQSREQCLTDIDGANNLAARPMKT